MAYRAAVLEATLCEMRVWIEHWEADRRCQLAPTERSLRDAMEIIDRVLAGGEPSRIGRMFLATPAEPAQPLSRYALAAE